MGDSSPAIPSGLVCDRCGYDLRGTQSKGNCPECGRLVTDAKRAQERKSQELEADRQASRWIWAVLGAGAASGATIWAASPFVTGREEPWDARGLYYPASLLLAGVIAALPCPRRWYWAPVAIYVGQFAYAFIALPGGPLWILGLLAGVAMLVPAVIGAGITFGGWKLIHMSRNAQQITGTERHRT